MTNAERIAKKAKIGRRLLVGVVAALCALSLYTFAVNVQQGSDITNVHNDVTRIQKTPCGKHPANPSKRCEVLRQALASSESIVTSCIAHQRVEGTRGRNCDHFYVDVRQGGEPGPSSSGSKQQPRSASTGEDHQPSAPKHSDSGGRGGRQPKGGGESPSKPPPPKNPPPSAAAPENSPSSSTGSSAGSPPSNPKADPPAPGLIEQTTGAAADAVDQAGKEVGGAGNEVTCGVSPVLCP